MFKFPTLMLKSKLHRLFSTSRVNRLIIRPLEQNDHQYNQNATRKSFFTWQKILFMSSFSFIYYKLKSSFILHTTVSTPEIKVHVTGIDSINSLKNTLNELEASKLDTFTFPFKTI